ncbi:Phosphatidylinositol N-acetylglucosaminyltransferase subunit A [Trichinella nelsoni]|uniref:phosphatidylinositol N-acetylglucosaminyltransferase n=1 Tax=Trichinella nelsoni TaxID=6336 RepID=A0A0V0S244_9BILA|nr:Phosphatidylinositol N-acetylglucosaminyltransferase subunit A [Trichinella nelsoni]
MAMALPSLYEIAGSHLRVYEEFFSEATNGQHGLLKAEEAAAFLRRSNLDNATLGQVWNVADISRRGLLDKQGFFIALKLIALVQQGQQPVQENLAVDVDPPMFFGSGFTPVPFADNETEWCIQPDDRKKYEDIFYSLMPVNGKLSGEQVKPVLFNSGLSKNLLRKIWDLSDIDKDGHLDKHEMTLALHLVYRALENDPVPDVLPLSMIPPAKREQYKPLSTAPISRSHFSSTSLDGPPRSRASSVTSLDRYSSLEHTAPKHPFVSRSLSGTPVPVMLPCSRTAWPVDVGAWQLEFRNLDTNDDGLISGAEAKPNLCDTDGVGMLNLEQFALAMHLIEQKKKHNLEPPMLLTPDLIPPSCRPPQRGVSMVDVDTSTDTPPPVGLDLANSPFRQEMDQISKEINNMQIEKRELEAEIVQAEADMKVKQAKIRNLEVEYNTLEATINQMERQKLEAQKRLDELDVQKETLEDMVSKLKVKLEQEEADMLTLDTDVERNSEFIRVRQEELNSKRAQLQQLRNEEKVLEQQLEQQMSEIRQASQQEKGLEFKIEMMQNTVDQLKTQHVTLNEQLAHCNGDVKLTDLNRLTDKLTLPPIESITLMDDSKVQHSNQNNEDEQKLTFIDNPFLRTTVSRAGDPFAQIEVQSQIPFTCEDPFATVDPFADASSFDVSNKDVFTSAAAGGFVSDPFNTSSSTNAPFDPFKPLDGTKETFNTQASSNLNFDDPWATVPSDSVNNGQLKKRPPPRPALPKNRPITPKFEDTSFDPFSPRQAMVSDYFCPNTGGVESHIYHLAECLVQRGHQIVIVTHHYEGRRGIRYLSNGLKIYYLPFVILFNQCVIPSLLSTLPAARYILQHEKIEILHSHSSLSTLAQEFMFHANLIGVRTVFTDHSLFGFADMASVAGNKMLECSLVHCNRVICVSHTGAAIVFVFSKENLVLRSSFPSERVYVIPNALDTHHFTPDPSQRCPSKINIVIACRLTYRKGIDLLARVIPRICNEHADVDFIIAGDGPMRILLEEVRESGYLQERVKMVGNIPHNKIRQILVLGNIFLNTSLTEAFCMTILEAASCGLHVVATRVGGVPEVLPKDLITLADVSVDDIVLVLGKVINRCRAGLQLEPWKVHRRIVGMYSWTNVAKRTERVYMDAVQDERHSYANIFAKHLSKGFLFGILMCIFVFLDLLYLIFLRICDSTKNVLSARHKNIKSHEQNGERQWVFNNNNNSTLRQS